MNGPPPLPPLRLTMDKATKRALAFGLACLAGFLLLATYTAANPCRTVFYEWSSGAREVISSSCGPIPEPTFEEYVPGPSVPRIET